MAMRIDERATAYREVDRFEGGVGWIAHPEETMLRASHALAIDGDVWVIDPVDADGLDDLFAEFGEVAGVVVTLDRHKRDAAAVATRHDVAVWIPDWFSGVAEKLDAPVERFGAELADTGIEAHPLKQGRFWQEVALYEPDSKTLVVPESVGTADYFRAGTERLGVHPMLRAVPPRATLSSFEPDRILVGHGPGIMSDATAALDEALSSSRRRGLKLYAENARLLLPF